MLLKAQNRVSELLLRRNTDNIKLMDSTYVFTSCLFGISSQNRLYPQEEAFFFSSCQPHLSPLSEIQLLFDYHRSIQDKIIAFDVLNPPDDREEK